MTMILLETVALSLALIFVLVHIRRRPDAGTYVARMALVSLAAWAAEESAIRWYHFYSYSPVWKLFLGQVPVMVIIVWTYVIHSAWDLGAQVMHPGRRWVPLLAAAIILTDAVAIETVAVNAAAWSWQRPGIFGVPPIGLLGWAFFAFFCLWILEARRSKRIGYGDLLLLAVPVIGTHGLLWLAWWGGFRWLVDFNLQASTVPAAWLLSVILVRVIAGRRLGEKVARSTLLLRLPAAVVFYFYLINLAMKTTGLVWLVALLTAWAPPYLVMMAQQYRIFGGMGSEKPVNGQSSPG